MSLRKIGSLPFAQSGGISLRYNDVRLDLRAFQLLHVLGERDSQSIYKYCVTGSIIIIGMKVVDLNTRES